MLMIAAHDFGHYGGLIPPLISEHGARVDDLLEILHVFMLLLFVGWGIFFVYCLARFRRKAGGAARYEPVKGKVSKYLEIGVAVFEAILLLVFSMPVWAEYKTNPPEKDDRVEIRVFGEQFQWDFQYPGPDGQFGRTSAEFIGATNPIGLDESDPNAADDIQTINELHLPVGRDIYFRLTSKDVIHSFAIPTARVKQDAIPGMEIPIWFRIKEGATTENLKNEMTRRYATDTNWYVLRHLVATRDYRDKADQVLLAAGDGLGATHREGERLLKKLREAGVSELEMQPANPLEVICAQLCGNSHFKMKAQIITHTPEAFDAWLKEQGKEVEIDFDEDF